MLNQTLKLQIRLKKNNKDAPWHSDEVHFQKKAQNIHRKRRRLKTVDRPCSKWNHTRYARGITIDFRSFIHIYMTTSRKWKFFVFLLIGEAFEAEKAENVKRFLESESGPNTFTFPPRTRETFEGYVGLG